jgi:hypothetical protein
MNQRSQERVRKNCPAESSERNKLRRLPSRLDFEGYGLQPVLKSSRLEGYGLQFVLKPCRFEGYGLQPVLKPCRL